MFDTAVAEQVTVELSEPTSQGELTVAQPDPITEGRAAWTRIKTASKMMRDDWRKVGEALLVGRKANRSDKLFGQWVKANGFGDIPSTARKDALWMVEHWDLLDKACPVAACHPTHIRAAYNDALTGAQDTEEQDPAPAALPKPPTLALPEPAAPTTPSKVL